MKEIMKIEYRDFNASLDRAVTALNAFIDSA